MSLKNYPTRYGRRSRPRSKSVEVHGQNSTLTITVDDNGIQQNKDSQSSGNSKSSSIKSTEHLDQLTPLVRKVFKPPFYRSYSLDSDPQYQVFLYGTSAPFLILQDPNTSETYKQNSVITIFAIWNTIIGSSLLAMPWSVQRAGLLTALLLMLAISTLAVYTAYRLLTVQLEYGKDDIGEVPYLCRLLLGSWAEVLSRVFSFVIIFGANIVYWILMTNFLYHTVGYLIDLFFDVPSNEEVVFGNESVLCPREQLLNSSLSIITEKTTFQKIWDLHYTVPIFLVLIVAPLLNFKSATFFTKFNSIGALSVIYLLIFVFSKSADWGINLNWTDETTVHFVRFNERTFAATSGMLPLSLFIHNIVITLMRNNRHQHNNCRDLSVAYILVVVTYIVIGFTFYICFPLPKICIEDNMLNNFPSWDIMTVIARIFLLFQLLTVFPLISYMLRIQVFSALNYPSYPSASHVMLLNLVNITTCVLFSIFLPHIGTVIRFTGAICGFVYIFTLPNLLYLSSMWQEQKLTIPMLIVHIAIPFIGLINLIAQFFVTD